VILKSAREGAVKGRSIAGGAFDELDAVVDAIVWFLELRANS